MNKLILLLVVSSCLGIAAFIMTLISKKCDCSGLEGNPKSHSEAKENFDYEAIRENFNNAKPALMIISCEKNKKNHSKFQSKPNTFVVIGKPDLDVSYKIIEENDIKYLYVKCKDIYFK